MAVGNHHFGNIGDIWKHLVWSALIDTMNPAQVWETHAGAAEYDLTPNTERQYGIYHYLEDGLSSNILESSAYSRVLHQVTDTVDELDTYPGSPTQSMALVDADGAEFLFCDIQQDCLASIEERSYDIAPNATIDCVNGDGVAIVSDALQETKSVTDTAIHIDPFETFTNSSVCGRSPIDLFEHAVERGATTVLWYGFESIEARTQRFGRVRTEIETRFDTTDDLWCGGVGFDVPDGVAVSHGPNLVGCHMLCGNMPQEVQERCRTLGTALANQYTRESLPSTAFGSLGYQEFFT